MLVSPIRAILPVISREFSAYLLTNCSEGYKLWSKGRALSPCHARDSRSTAQTRLSRTGQFTFFFLLSIRYLVYAVKVLPSPQAAAFCHNAIELRSARICTSS